MAFLSNAHTHSTWCDGTNPLPVMLEEAKKLGFVSLGFSGHAAQGFDFTYPMTPEEQEGYCAEIRALQKITVTPRIWLGMEVDVMSHADKIKTARSQIDYMLGSSHYLFGDSLEDWAAVDGPIERLKSLMERVYHNDGIAAARKYYQTAAEAMLREKPDIIGHFDLIRKYAGRLGYFDENDPAYRKLAREALEKIFPAGSVLEVNTGGIARNYLPTPYPTLELLCVWRELGGKVTITSDCHNASLLTCAFDLAEQLIREAGFRSVMRLGAGDQLWDEVEL